MELHRLARYPFLPQAAHHVAEHGPSLEELLGERVYAGVREKARARVLAAIEEAELPAPALSAASPARDLLEELLSYVLARILVSALKDPYVVRRHALAEAVRVRALLAQDDDARAIADAAEALDLPFEPVEGAREYRTHFTDYLRYAVHLKDMEWKLVRQPLQRGSVTMDAATASRLVQEALRRRIESELPKPLPPEVEKALEPALAPLREVANERKDRYSVEGTFGKVDLSVIPPCMQHILGQLQRGENAAHNARFALVTFLHRIGMTPDDIMALFAQAPDFREDLTRYQVEHITGVTSGTVYNVPGCDNLQTFNLCLADDLCRTKLKDGRSRVRWPVDYYRYMVEARPHVEAIAARVPLENARALVHAAARQYALLKKLESLAARPWMERLDGARLLRVAKERGAPVALAGEPDAPRLVVDDADPWGLARLLESEHVREALTAEPAGPKK